MTDEFIEGVVTENRGAVFDVIVDGRVVQCTLRGRLKKGKQRDASPIAAGDRVKLTMLEPERGIVERVLARESDLSRAAAGSVPLRQTIAANVEQAVIVFAAAEPRADLFLLDRFLVVATTGGLELVICVNKCDLVEREALREQFGLYRDIGYCVLFTSAVTGEGLDDLRGALKDRRSVICGPSGVGKSSLLNALAPGLALRTAEVGPVTHKGRHTTRWARLVPLPFGGSVADTPGLRQLGFCEVSPEQVAAAFPDLLPHLGRCRFNDCSHRTEPGCALQEAASAGEIDQRRLRSFLQMGGR